MNNIFRITPLNKSKITIGLLMTDDEELLDEYVPMNNGIFEAAKKNNINIIKFVFPKRFLNKKNIDYELNVIYDFIDNFKLDGLLFLGLIYSLNDEYFIAFKKRFKSTPIFSIGRNFDDIPNVYMHGGIYVKEMLIHLIKSHGYKRIVFIPPIFPDERQEFYKNTMNEYGLYDPKLVISYDNLHKKYSFNDRIDFIEKVLYDDLKLNFDAIFGMYHTDAIEIFNRLSQKGVSVPNDIAFVGFNDGDIMKYCIPPFTTIYFPFRELGYTACEKFVELLTTGSVELSTHVAGKLIIRESCGCSPNIVKPMANNKVSINLNEKPSLEQKKQSLYNFFDGVETLAFDARKLIDAMFQTLQDKSSNPFLNELQRQLIASVKGGFYRINEILFVKLFQEKIICTVEHDEIYTPLMNEIWLNTFSLIKQFEQILLGKEKAKMKESNEALVKLALILITTFDIDKAFDIISEKFLLQNMISDCYVFLFNESKERYNNCSLVFEYENNKRIPSNNKIIENPEKFLLEQSRTQNINLVIQKLIVDNDVFGFIVFGVGEEYSRFLYNISIQISMALKSILTFRKLEDLNTNLEIIVRERTNLLKESNDELVASNDQLRETLDALTKAQNQLVQSEKMAALGKLVSGVAHEINTPIGVSITAVSHQLEQINSFKKYCAEDKLSKSKLNSFLDTLDETGSIILNNLQRTRELVSDFKKVAVDESNEKKQLFKIRDYTSLVLLSLGLDYKAIKRKINLICDHNLEINSYPVAIAQLFTNLIINSFTHAFEKDGDGSIVIEIQKKGDMIFVIYSDNGKGIPKDIQHKIFDPFFTTNRSGGGTGLGLHIVYNIVTQKLCGTIACESEVGKGTKFMIEFKE